MSCRTRYRKQLPRKTTAAIRADLLEREKQIDRKAALRRRAAGSDGPSRQERERVKHWKLRADGFRAIAPGLKDSVRRARTGMVTAWLHPTAGTTTAGAVT